MEAHGELDTSGLWACALSELAEKVPRTPTPLMAPPLRAASLAEALNKIVEALPQLNLWFPTGRFEFKVAKLQAKVDPVNCLG